MKNNKLAITVAALFLVMLLGQRGYTAARGTDAAVRLQREDCAKTADACADTAAGRSGFMFSLISIDRKTGAVPNGGLLSKTGIKEKQNSVIAAKNKQPESKGPEAEQQMTGEENNLLNITVFLFILLAAVLFFALARDRVNNDAYSS